MPRALPLLLLAACGGEFKPLTDLHDSGGDSGGTTADGGAAGDGGGATGDGGGASGDGGADGGSGDGGGAGDGGTAWPGGTADYCHIQWPCSQAGTAGATSEAVYVWVYEEGLTVGAGGGAGVLVELGVGPDGGSPAAGAGWSWTGAAWSADKDGLVAGDLANDEYSGTFTLPDAAGQYDYCGRVSLDGGASWLYCDLAENDGNGCGGQGSDDGYLPAHAGALTVQ